MRASCTLALLIGVLGACDGVPDPVADPTPRPDSEGTCLAHDFGTTVLAPYQEIGDQCMSWTLDNAETLLVNSVSTANDGWFHHSNWFWVPDDWWELPDGYWDCSDLAFTELGAALVGGVLYAQSTQTNAETQAFVDGAAIEIPPNARIIAWAHLLNLSDEARQTGLRLQLGLLAPDEVDTILSPFRFNYSDLRLPPNTRTEHAGDCDIDTVHQAVTGDPLELKLHYVLPHYHALGDSFRLEISGGPRDGEAIFEQLDAYGEPLGHTFEEPVDLAGATGLRFSCGHDNPRDVDVFFGIGDQEMCVMLGFADTAIRFDGDVDLTTDVSEQPDGTVLRTGACNVNGFQL